MVQQELEFEVNGISHKVTYQRITDGEGTRYEGLLGNLPFTFSSGERGFNYSSSLQDVTLRKQLIAAVLDKEDILQNPSAH